MIEEVSFTLPVAGLTLPPPTPLLESSVPPVALELLFVPSVFPAPLESPVLSPPSIEKYLDRDDADLEDVFELIESQRLMLFILEVALDGINRSEIPKSMEFARLEFLRRRDDDTVVPLVLPLLTKL